MTMDKDDKRFFLSFGLMAFLALLLNLALLVGAVWVVVLVLRATGVIS